MGRLGDRIDEFIETLTEVLELKVTQLRWRNSEQQYDTYSEGFQMGIEWERERVRPLK